MRMRKLAAFGVFIGIISPRTGLAYDYTVSDLGLFGVTAINNAGQMTGQYGGESVRTSSYTPFNAITDYLPLGLYNINCGTRINDYGVVSGYYMSDSTDTWRAYKYASTFVDIGDLGGVPITNPGGLNNSGVVVGGSMSTLGPQVPVIYSGSTLSQIGSFTTTSYAQAINDSGLVVGSVGDDGYPHTQMQAFTYNGTTVSYITIFGGLLDSYVQVADVNNSGVFIGHAWGDSSGGGFYYDTSAHLIGAGFIPWDINNSGVIVGEYYGVAAIYVGGNIYELNDLIDPLSGWNLVKAVGINDDGYIVGHGGNGLDSYSHSFLLSPESYRLADITSVPDPVSTAIVGVAIIAKSNMRRRCW